MVTALIGFIGMGMGAILMGMEPVSTFWLAVAGIFIKGMLQSISNAPIIAILQSTVEPAMQERVISLIISLTSAAAPVGLLITGLFGERLSVQSWFIIFGGGCVILGSISFLIPSLVRLGENTKAIQKQAINSKCWIRHKYECH
jgi:DHA3 family macrolide efflux protein-like MFS transporter